MNPDEPTPDIRDPKARVYTFQTTIFQKDFKPVKVLYLNVFKHIHSLF